MTVTVDSRRREYSGNGVATSFNGPMAYQPQDVQVFLTVGGVTSQVSPGEYEIDRFGRASGTRVVMNTPPPSGSNLLLLRTVPYSQDVDITNQGAFHAETIEKGFDALAMQTQQLADGLSFSVQLREDYPIPRPDLRLPDPESSRLIGWNVAGDALRNVDPTGPGDLTLRSDLADADGGAALVGYPGGGKVSDLATWQGAGMVGFRHTGVGAVSRDIRAKLIENVSVLDYGADPTGTVDSTAAFTAALAAAVRVHAPTGTYLIYAGFGMVAGRTLYGDGAGTVLKRVAGSAINSATINMASGATVERLKLDGTASGQVSFLYGIRGFNVTGAVVRDVIVTNSRGVGIGWANSEECRVIDCEVTGMVMVRSAYWAEGGVGRHRWLNCSAHHNQGDGMNIGAPGCRVEGGSYCFNGYGGSYGAALGAAGIFTVDGTTVQGLSIIGVEASDNSEYGLNVGANDVVLIGNTCNRNQLDGIILKNGTRLTVSNNTCNDNGWYPGSSNPTSWVRAGIIGLPSTSYVTLSGNTCRDTRTVGSKQQDWGIYFATGHTGGPASNWSLVGNITDGNKTANDNINPSVGAYLHTDLSGVRYLDYRGGENKRRVATTATPDVGGGVRILQATGPVSITNLVNGVTTQIVTIVCDGGTVTLVHGNASDNGLRLAGGVNAVLTDYGANLTLLRMPNSTFHEIGRTI